MEAEKELKYKNLSIEIQWVWNIKCFVIPLIIETMRIETKGLKKSGNSTRKAVNRFFFLKKKALEILHMIKCYKLKLEAWVVGCTSGSFLGYQDKGNLWKETSN
jgi:hypothetical protein